MRILVIGGTGFIGSAIVRRLIESGHETGVFHRVHRGSNLPANVQHLIGNRNRLMDQRQALAQFAPEIVVDGIAGNQKQARELIDALRGIARRLIVLSSGDVYRAAGVLARLEPAPLEPIPLTEEARLRGVLYLHQNHPTRDQAGWVSTDYEKILVERAVMRHPDLPATILRLPMTYGPGDNNRRFYAYLKRMDDRRPAILLDRATAQWRGAWDYVENIAEAIVCAVENPASAGRIYNICYRDQFTMAEMVTMLGDVAGWKGRIVISGNDCPPPSMSTQFNLEQHLFMDSVRIRRELGYRERTGIMEALARTAAWDRGNPPHELDAALFDYESEDRVLRQNH